MKHFFLISQISQTFIFSLKHYIKGVKCGEPPSIRNGELSSNVKQKTHVFGDKILYTCQEGHLPRGDLSSLCLKGGTWSDVKGQCSSKFNIVESNLFLRILRRNSSFFIESVEPKKCTTGV